MISILWWVLNMFYTAPVGKQTTYNCSSWQAPHRLHTGEQVNAVFQDGNLFPELVNLG